MLFWGSMMLNKALHKDFLVMFFIKCLTIILAIFITGCATPRWNTRLWQTDEPLNTEKPEIGSLQTDIARYDFIVTEFVKIEKNPSIRAGLRPTFIGIGISCNNYTNETIVLEESPIQVIDASKTLVKQLPLNHVMYNLYGGKLRDRELETKLAELRQPAPGSSSVFLSALSGAMRGMIEMNILSELHSKEIAFHELYYQSFTPTSLPSGVSAVWTEYYSYTSQPVTVMLQGQHVNDGILFSQPRPKIIEQQRVSSLTSLGLLLAIPAAVLVIIAVISINS